MRRNTGALLVAAGLLAVGVQARAADRKVEIINSSGQSLTHFYASSTGSDSWEEDILGRDTVDNGDSFTANIDDGSGACKFDFKGQFENGNSAVKRNVDVCTISRFTFTR